MTATQRKPRLFSLGFIGTDHEQEQSTIDPTQWVYTSNILNLTSTTFEEIVVFFSQHGRPGVIFLRVGQTPPGTLVTFRLGVCKDLKEYVIGLFWREGGELFTDSIPPVGAIVPPLGEFRCMDSVDISDA